MKRHDVHGHRAAASSAAAGAHPRVVAGAPPCGAVPAHILVWWRAHRPAAPFQFEEDFETPLDRLQLFPLRGVVVGARQVHVLHTRRTRHPFFYRVRPRARRVEVIAIGRG